MEPQYTKLPVIPSLVKGTRNKSQPNISTESRITERENKTFYNNHYHHNKDQPEREHSFSPESFKSEDENPKEFSQTFCRIFNKPIDWSENIKNYEKGKKNLKWGKNPPVKYFKDFHFKTMDTFYNPITQKYKDDSLNEADRKIEKKILEDKLATYYDEQLRMSQTFNIINLQDKLKVFENDPNYPRKEPKNLYTKERNPSKQEYNIISNINLKQHHYDKPENRKNLPSGDKKIISEKAHLNLNTINIKCYKDYDIITNKYKEFDEEKKKTDIEFNKLNAAKNMLKKGRDYDIIRGVFCDPLKEKNFQQEINISKEKLRARPKEGLFNPFNNEIYDEKKVKEIDLFAKTSKMRYTIRPKIEKYYRDVDLIKDVKYKKVLRNKLIYERFKNLDNRGYNVLTLGERCKSYKNLIECKNKKDPWEILQNGVNNNETISKKGIYKSPYDKADIEKNCFEFRTKRIQILNNLSDIKDDKNFGDYKLTKKINSDNINKNYEAEKNRDNYKVVFKNAFSQSKEEWFNKDKDIQVINGRKKSQ